MQDFRRLRVWQSAHELLLAINQRPITQNRKLAKPGRDADEPAPFPSVVVAALVPELLVRLVLRVRRIPLFRRA